MTYNIPRGLRPLSLLALAALAACGGSGDDDTPRYSAEIRRTTMGVPHIKANDWGGLGYGYGYGYVQAQDNLCTMADCTRAYGAQQWLRVPFAEAEITADKNDQTVTVSK